MTKFYDLTKQFDDKIEIVWTPQMSRFFYSFYLNTNVEFYLRTEEGMVIGEISKYEYKILDKYLRGNLKYFEYNKERN